jgi:hypothetical protein
MKDLHNNVKALRAISPVSVADNTAQVSQIIDRQGFKSLEFLILIGAVADVDATFAVTIDHGDASNLSDAAAVPAAQLLGTLALAGFQFDSDDQTRKIGYVGIKRFVRLTITPSANASAALLAAVAVLGHPNMAPQSAQNT